MSNTLLMGSTGMLGAVGATAAYIQYKSPSNAYDYCDTDVMPEKRAVRFQFEEADIANWNGYGKFQSIFMNSLSMFFPVGEAFFVRAVQAHRDAAGVKEDEKLRKQVNAFVAQESIHGREHDRYNDVIKARFPVSKYIEYGADGILGITERLGTRFSLAVTVALEHWTGLMGGALLECPSIYSKGDPKIGLVWHWHAMEETEHKAVAYDVYSRAYGFNLLTWIEKSVALILATVILWTMVYAGFIACLITEGCVFNVVEWYKLLVVHWGFSYQGERVGVLRACILPFFDFFHPAFHPWKWSPAGEHEKLQQSMKEFEQELAEYYDQDDKDGQPEKPKASASGDKQKQTNKSDGAKAAQQNGTGDHKAEQHGKAK